MLTKIVESASTLGGAFSKYNKENQENGPLALALGFADVFDPFSRNSALRPILEAVIDIFQEIIAIFIFGNNCEKPCAQLLPSKINEVLLLKESRDEKIYLKGGCDAGELASLEFQVFSQLCK